MLNVSILCMAPWGGGVLNVSILWLPGVVVCSLGWWCAECIYRVAPWGGGVLNVSILWLPGVAVC